MKKFIFTLLFFGMCWAQGLAQSCTPHATTGTANVSPPTDSLSCASIGQPYNQSIYVENFNTYSTTYMSIPITVTMDSLKVDSLTNLPCGLNYAINPATGIFHAGQTGCINIYGTTYDTVGQYKTGIYIHLDIHATIIGALHFSGLADSVIKSIQNQYGVNLNINFGYWIRVNQNGGSCPLVDTSASANNRKAQKTCAAPAGQFFVNINGPKSACATDSININAVVTGNPTGAPTYLWSNGATTDTVKVLATDSARVIVSAGGTSDTSSYYHTTITPLPTAHDSGYVVGSTGHIISRATNASISAYVLYKLDSIGNRTTIDSFNFNGMDTTVTFTANGNYLLRHIVANACGADTLLDSITINSIVSGVTEINNINAYVSIFPNPSNGQLNLKIASSSLSNENYSVKIYNAQGQMVYTEMVSGNVNQQLNLTYLSAGVYLVHVNSPNFSTVQKLFIR